MADTGTVDEPGLGAIIMIDYGFEHGGALRSSMYVHTSAGWSRHPDGRRPVTWARLIDLDGLNARLHASDSSLGIVHGYRLTVLAYSPIELLDSLLEERGGQDLAPQHLFLDSHMERSRA